jgi:hypothetical protein
VAIVIPITEFAIGSSLPEQSLSALYSVFGFTVERGTWAAVASA